MKKIILNICFLLILPACLFLPIKAQQLEGAVVTYQGSLKDGNAPANGNYEIKLEYFDAATGGASLGSITYPNLPVVNGIFSLTFNGSINWMFPGRGLWIQTSVRPAGSSSPLTILAPRQQITSTPFSISSLLSADSQRLGGIEANQYLTATSGAATFIQNGTTQQTGSFNLDGTGTANIFNAATQFSVNGNRILSAGGADNIFAGFQAGQANTTGASNSFFGVVAGNLNTTGSSNSFFGRTTGRNNSTGSANSFFGNSAGVNNTSGNSNSFFGTDAGFSNTTGTGNTIIGGGANVGGLNLTNASAFGYRAYVTQSNSLVLGSINGVNGATADTFVGIGTTAPTYKLQIVDASNKGLRVQTSVLGGTVASFGTSGAFQVDAPGMTGGRLNILENGNVGLGTGNPLYKLHVVGENIRIESPVPDVFPRFSINFSSAGLNQKKWQNYANATALNFTAISDDESAETFWMQVNRGAGTAVTNVVFPNGNVGIGNTNPTEKLRVTGTGLFTGRLTVNGGLNYFDTSGNANFFMKSAGAANGINFGVVGVAGTNSVLYISQYDGATYQDRLIVDNNGIIFGATKIVAGATTSTPTPNVKLEVNGFTATGLDSNGITAVCRNANAVLAFCSSSIRYKQNIQNYAPGLDLIRRLRPVSFNWKSNNEADFGLVAEETAEVEPLLTTRNEKGETEGVKYDRVGVVLINAVNEQQDQIEAQQKQSDEQKTRIEIQQRRTDSQAELIKQQQERLDKQQSEIEALKAIVCASNRTAKICEEKKP